MTTPTTSQFAAYQSMFDHLNQARRDDTEATALERQADRLRLDAAIKRTLAAQARARAAVEDWVAP